MTKREAILCPLGLATVLAIGFGVVVAIAVGWPLSIVEGLSARGGVYDTLMVQADGTPLIRRYTYQYYYSVETYRTLDGKEVPRPKNDNWSGGGNLKGPPELYKGLFPLGGTNRIAVFSDDRRPPTLWYFIHDGTLEGRGYFVGFQSETKVCVGYLGSKGFRPDVPPDEERFAVDGRQMATRAAFSRDSRTGDWYSYAGRDGDPDADFPAWKVQMISDGQLLEIDLRNGSVAALMKSPELQSLGIFTPALPPDDSEKPKRRRHQYLAVRTAEQILVFDAAGKQLRSYAIPQDLRGLSITFYEVGSGRVLIDAIRTHRDHSQHHELCWIDEGGNVHRRREVTLAGARGAIHERGMAWKTAAIVPAPIAMVFFATVVGPLTHLLEAGVEPDYFAAMKRSLAAQWPPLLTVFAVAAVLAWFSYRRHRRYALPWSGVWVAFVLLLGIPGLLAYRYHRRWPVLAKCPTCNHRVSHDRETCSHCGAEFPGPEPKGIEVFA